MAFTSYVMLDRPLCICGKHRVLHLSSLTCHASLLTAALLQMTSVCDCRLSEQLTALPKLMQPVVSALKGPPALVVRALKVLDTWIDSLNPEFLEPAMAPVSKYVLSIHDG